MHALVRVLPAAVLMVGLVTPWGSARAADPPNATPRPGARRPNVLIYLVDTLRADHLGLYGYDQKTSPGLDAWAAGGVVFDRAYAPTSWTRPSVVSLLTGLDAISHGVEDRLDVIPDEVRLLSERLHANGYATFAAVTNPNVLPEWGFARGYERYDDLDSVGHGTRADAVSDFVVGRMDELARRQPFFFYVHVIDPHAPYDPPPPFDTRFPPVPALPAKLSTGRYDGEVAFVDAQFARIVDALRARGLEDDTMVVFVADHGEEILDHGGFGHGSTLFEEVVRVPLVIRFPGGAHAGRRVEALASLIDVTPTILAALGLPPPPDLDGRDLTEVLGPDDSRWADRRLFLSLATTGPESRLIRGVVGSRYKYLRDSRPASSERLFDLAHDPRERASAAPAEPDLRARSSAALDTHLARRSNGIHLRVVHAPRGTPVGCEARVTTTGRFVDVAGVRLETEDRFELSADRRRLRLHARLENRTQSLLEGTRRVPDEDGLVIEVDPPGASVTVEQLELDHERPVPLAAGARREPQPLPFAFEPTADAWSVRDADALLEDGEASTNATTRAYVGVIRSPASPASLPTPLVDRLRALGYLPTPRGAP